MLRSIFDACCWILVGVISIVASGQVGAQEYPSRLIRFIVPDLPGLPPDLMARALAPEMSKFLGQPIVVENKPGAGTLIAYDYVAKQVPPDGYTFVIVAVGFLALMPSTAQALRFDPVKDLPPFIGLGEGRLVLGSSSKHPWTAFSGLIDHARNNPGKLNFGAVSPLTRILQESIVQAAGIKMVYVPYSTGISYIQGLTSGDVHMGITTESSARSMGEKYRVFAVSGQKRLDAWRDAPTFTELGFAHIRGLAWSLNVAGGTSKSITDKLHASASTALRQPSVRSIFEKLPLEIIEQTGDVAAGSFADQMAFLSNMARTLGIQPQ